MMVDGGGNPHQLQGLPGQKRVWKGYNVVIENVSLVMNYRSQFNDVLAKGTHDELLEILRKKAKGQKS
jgi:ABC-type transporter MlaC component